MILEVIIVNVVCDLKFVEQKKRPLFGRGRFVICATMKLSFSSHGAGVTSRTRAA